MNRLRFQGRVCKFPRIAISSHNFISDYIGPSNNITKRLPNNATICSPFGWQKSNPLIFRQGVIIKWQLPLFAFHQSYLLKRFSFVFTPMESLYNLSILKIIPQQHFTSGISWFRFFVTKISGQSHGVRKLNQLFCNRPSLFEVTIPPSPVL